MTNFFMTFLLPELFSCFQYISIQTYILNYILTFLANGVSISRGPILPKLASFRRAADK